VTNYGNKVANKVRTAPSKVQLFLTQDPSALVEKLKATGLDVWLVRSKEKLVIGRRPLDKLTEIA